MGTLYGGPAGPDEYPPDIAETYLRIDEQPREALEKLAQAKRIEEVKLVAEGEDDHLTCLAVDMTVDGTTYKMSWEYLNPRAIADLLYAAKGGDENHAYVLSELRDQAQEALTNPQS
jgi:hypothetical protein